MVLSIILRCRSAFLQRASNRVVSQSVSVGRLSWGEIRSFLFAERRVHDIEPKAAEVRAFTGYSQDSLPCIHLATIACPSCT